MEDGHPGEGVKMLRRSLLDRGTQVICGLCALSAVAALGVILLHIIIRGAPAVDLDFLTGLPTPVGVPGGGLGNAILGTLILLALAAAFSLPPGILTGIFLSEYRGRLSPAIRFIADVLAGVPSIIVGIFIYTLLVLPMKSFSALAGGLALSIIMVPIIARSTEESLKLVPDSVREAAWALGVTRWRTIVSVVLPTALGGILTGAMLALARAAGETAPLLFTALNSRYWFAGLTKPIASLPVYIYTYGISPYSEWQAQAWGGALILLVFVLALSFAARLFAGKRKIS